MLLWHIFRDIKTQWPIWIQNRSIRGSNSLMIEKILLKHKTEDNLLKGSGWFELLSILLIKDLMLAGFSLISLSDICFKLHLANSATALLHIILKLWLFLLEAPSIRESSKASTSWWPYTLLLENHLTI